VQCLEKMFKAHKEEPIYVIVDAVDECPDTSGLQSFREKVLELIKDLVRPHLSNLRLCVTSRPEVDIRNVLEPLTSTTSRISLHDQDGQKKDIDDYVRSVVYSDRKMMKWRDEDKMLVVKTLSERADGMYGSPFLLGTYSDTFEIGLDGSHARSKLYAAVLHRTCDVFLQSCLKL